MSDFTTAVLLRSGDKLLTDITPGQVLARIADTDSDAPFITIKWKNGRDDGIAHVKASAVIAVYA